jgi:hypothetical protein
MRCRISWLHDLPHPQAQCQEDANVSGLEEGLLGQREAQPSGWHNRLYTDYFYLTDLVFKEVMLRRWYRMSRDLS